MYVTIHRDFAQVLKECQLLSTQMVHALVTLAQAVGRGLFRQQVSHAVLVVNQKRLISGWNSLQC